MARTISVDTPLAEITLRKYERPRENDGRDVARKVCLSLGLLQPGDSRDVIVDVFHVLLKSDQELSSKEVEKLTKENRKEHKLPMQGIAPSNIRRQLLRLRDMFLVEKVKNSYRIRENATLSHIFDESIKEYYLDSILSRVKEYLKMADSMFLKK